MFFGARGGRNRHQRNVPGLRRGPEFPRHRKAAPIGHPKIEQHQIVATFPDFRQGAFAPVGLEDRDSRSFHHAPEQSPIQFHIVGHQHVRLPETNQIGRPAHHVAMEFAAGQLPGFVGDPIGDFGTETPFDHVPKAELHQAEHLQPGPVPQMGASQLDISDQFPSEPIFPVVPFACHHFPPFVRAPRFRGFGVRLFRPDASGSDTPDASVVVRVSERISILSANSASRFPRPSSTSFPVRSFIAFAEIFFNPYNLPFPFNFPADYAIQTR